ncbi:RNA polymerase sigma-I factor [Massilibacterium senegalense]|uniref:RNA polymerase sigma-I factor n=1 Tax=Massilibacterium senegalense TaxID=1632858 RepID=UPI000A69BB3B|nr:RNA polymerase sigma-I factor [Massilibacterium senegalense]
MMNSREKVIDTTLELEDKVLLIQQGNESLRNEILSEYQPFVKKVTSKVCNQYIDESMDEYSVGLCALNEAIDQYNPHQGSKFLSFSNMVIRRRVIDYIRREQRQKRLFFFVQEDDNEQRMEESYLEQQVALDHYRQHLQIENRVSEINEFRELLKEYNITFDVLSKQCPKHIDARENAKEIARIIVENEEFSNYLQEKKQLPIKALLTKVSCSRKTIERNRKYIIAVALIYLGKFTALQSYIE